MPAIKNNTDRALHQPVPLSSSLNMPITFCRASCQIGKSLRPSARNQIFESHEHKAANIRRGGAFQTGSCAIYELSARFGARANARPADHYRSSNSIKTSPLVKAERPLFIYFLLPALLFFSRLVSTFQDYCTDLHRLMPPYLGTRRSKAVYSGSKLMLTFCETAVDRTDHPNAQSSLEYSYTSDLPG